MTTTMVNLIIFSGSKERQRGARCIFVEFSRFHEKHGGPLGNPQIAIQIRGIVGKSGFSWCEVSS
jgi:hypothetical protein